MEIALGLAVVLVLLVLAVRRALTVLCVEARAGEIVLARGRASSELLRELGDVLRRAKATGKVELRLERGIVAVRGHGLDETTMQRLRNVVGRFPKARLTQAPKVAQRT